MRLREKGDIIRFVRQKDYLLEKYLDSGGFGKTVLLLDPVMNEYFVCKKYEPQPHVDRGEYYENFKNEIKIMHKLFHKNIIRIFNYHLFPKSVTGYILMDYIDGTDIETYVSKNPEEINNIFSQAIEGFSYLETNNILHRDIRPKNILVTRDNTLKIIDFGFGKRIVNNDDFEKSISLNWSDEAPLDFKDHIYDFKTEIYFVGKLFESLIRDRGIAGFRYNELLKKMTTKSHDMRIESFSHIQETIINDTSIFEDYFSCEEKEIFRGVMSNIVDVYSSVSSDCKYVSSIDQLIVELEEVLKLNILENYVQNNLDISKLFIKGRYRYYQKEVIYVGLLKEFIRLLKSCDAEKKDILRSAIVNRLRTIKKNEADDGLTTDIPF
jgi:serine/threonine-protein kinase